MIFISPGLAPRLRGVNFGARVPSDHSPYWIDLELKGSTVRSSWRLNPFWLSLLPEAPGLQDEWMHFFTANIGTAGMGTVWETFKTYARLILSNRISKYKHSSNIALTQAETHLQTLGQNFQSDPSIHNALTLKSHMRMVNTIHMEKAKRHIFFAKQRTFGHGERGVNF